MSLPARILLVEDDPVHAQLALALLREAIPACSVTYVETIAGAAGILGVEAFDAVLLDLRLPDGSGIDALQRVRDAAGATPIVVLTSVADDELAAEMVAAGAEDYLVKGRLAPESLVRVLRFATLRQMRSRRDSSDEPADDRPLVALVGRHALLLDGLAAALRASGAYGAVGTIATALDLAARKGRNPDVVVVHLPEAGDADETEGSLSALRACCASARIVLLAGNTGHWLPAVLERADAEALLPDTSASAEIIAALGRVLDGEVVLPPQWRALRNRDARTDPLEVLSARQREVLVQAAAGYSNEEIAEQLFITVNTVKFHVRSAYSTLGIRSRLQAAQLVGATGG